MYFFQVQYFKYPNAVLFSILDNKGRLGGGEEIKIVVQEPTSSQTRYAAALPNFIMSSPDGSIDILFGQSTAEILSVRIAGDQITMNIRAPQSKLAEENSVRVNFLLGGLPVDMSNLGHSQYYKYQGAFISIVSPRSGLTTGGQGAKLVVSDLSAIALEGLPEVNFGGQICSGVSFKFFDTGNLEIKVTTPNDDAPGDTEVSVRSNRKTAEPITLTGRGLFEFIVPLDPFLDRLSLTINGESGGDIYAFNQVSVEGTFTLKHLYLLRGDPFTIHLGAGIQYETPELLLLPQEMRMTCDPHRQFSLYKQGPLFPSGTCLSVSLQEVLRCMVLPLKRGLLLFPQSGELLRLKAECQAGRLSW